MALDREWLLATARAEREALGRTVQYTEPDRWSAPSGANGWRNRDVVAHLASTEVAAAESVSGAALAEVEAYILELGSDGPPTVDGFNAFAVARREELPFRAVVGEWGAAADRLLSACARVPDDAWGSTRAYWVVGQMRIGSLLQSRVMEWWIHGEDIRTGADLPSRRIHPPMYCVNDLAIRSIPYALSLVGRSYAGKVLQVQLEGAGGGTWRYGLAPREVPAADAKPDVVVEGFGYEFARVAGRRLPAATCLEAGTLLLAGDVAIGEEVLANLRAFA